MVHDGVRLVVVVHRLDAGWPFGRVELGLARSFPMPMAIIAEVWMSAELRLW